MIVSRSGRKNSFRSIALLRCKKKSSHNSHGSLTRIIHYHNVNNFSYKKKRLCTPNGYFWQFWNFAPTTFSIWSYKSLIHSLRHLWKKKNEKQKKEGWIARDIFFNFLLLSFLFHENASVFFCIFDIFNNYGLKSLQNNTGEAVHSRSRSYN